MVAVGEHLGLDAVGPPGEDVDPLGPAVLDHEDQRPAVALDHRASGDDDPVREPGGLEPDVGVHARAQRSLTRR